MKQLHAHTRLWAVAFAALFATSAMAAAFVPTSVYTVGDESTLGAKWADKGQPNNYFVKGDTVVFCALLSYQSAASGCQEWIGVTESGSSKTTWDATSCFVGNTAWGTGDAGTKASGVRTSRMTYYNVTNCTSVLALVNGTADKKGVTLKVYEIVDGKVAAEPSASDEMIGNKVSILTVKNLVASKTYQVQVAGTTDNNSFFYEIAFVAPAPAKDDATLSAITIDGVALEDFAPEKLTYNVELTYGTITVPTVVATPNSKNANAVVTAAASLPGTTTIVVTAEDKTTTITYTINFTVAASKSTDATLSALTVDGKAITLTEGILEYAYELPAYAPGVVAAAAHHEKAKATVTQAAAIPGAATVLVTAEAGNTQTYTVNLTQKEALQQVAVSADTKWDWTKAGVSEIRYSQTTAISKTDTIVMANAMDSTWTNQIANSADFNSQALRVVGEYMVRDSKHFQGPYVSFVAEKAGSIKVVFSNTGSNGTRYLWVNGEKTKWGSSESKNNTTTDAIAVKAGTVALTFMLEAGEKYEYGRIYSIEYTASSTPSALDNASSEVKAVKIIRNGQLLIQKGDKLYTAQGTVLE